MEDTEWTRKLLGHFEGRYRLPAPADSMFRHSAKGPCVDRGYTRWIFSEEGDENFVLWKIYARGYKEAGDKLCTHVLDDDGKHLLFPLLMCFHQHLELLLKLLSFWVMGNFPDKGHALAPIWKQISKKRRDLLWGPRGTAESVERLLEEYDTLTESGEGTRYPFSSKKRKTYLKTLRKVDIRNLQGRMHSLSHYLSQMLLALERNSGFEEGL